MWNRDEADPLDENMSAISLNASPFSLVLIFHLIEVTARIPCILNTAGSHLLALFSRMESSSQGTSRLFAIFFEPVYSDFLTRRAQCGWV